MRHYNHVNLRCSPNKLSNLIEMVFPKQKIRSSSKPKEGCVRCAPGYDYWIIMENPAIFFPGKITALYKLELGFYNWLPFDIITTSNDGKFLLSRYACRNFIFT